MGVPDTDKSAIWHTPQANRRHISRRSLVPSPGTCLPGLVVALRRPYWVGATPVLRESPDPKTSQPAVGVPPPQPTAGISLAVTRPPSQCRGCRVWWWLCCGCSRLGATSSSKNRARLKDCERAGGLRPARVALGAVLGVARIDRLTELTYRKFITKTKQVAI